MVAVKGNAIGIGVHAKLNHSIRHRQSGLQEREMWKFRWTHKKPVNRRLNGVVDCVTTIERISARITVLVAEAERLAKNPTAESLDTMFVLDRRTSRLLDHAHRVKDIQAAWCRL